MPVRVAVRTTIKAYSASRLKIRSALLHDFSGGGDVSSAFSLHTWERRRSKEGAPLKHLVAIHHEFSAQSMVLAAIFAAVLAAAVLIDLAGLLQFAGLISGLPARIEEIGGALTAIAIFPLIAMGLSISHDLNHKTE